MALDDVAAGGETDPCALAIARDMNAARQRVEGDGCKIRVEANAIVLDRDAPVLAVPGAVDPDLELAVAPPAVVRSTLDATAASRFFA